ncbi:phosphonatase-like hydrolase [Dactylosporangium sucinum]|uniref:Haloacid dehalogenase-like hydrolase n=1 Tax=Dactylosporangium sucinum TaxID=1424081 RepID=A0A917X5U4_9ACTN|nr:phosphonatase-like hydrolase [Dactylosporangium sucinum]GGM68997.1 putative haloacid dehalogenase-like hydrolase [Dactylosporangium sucinum]
MVALVVLDMAGTTVRDDGLVERAFTAAIAEQGVAPDDPAYAPMLAHVRATMGESKISVFRHLLAGDEARAQAANAAFEAAYGDLVDAGHCAEIEGAAAVVEALRTAGVRVALTTGFSRATADRILAALGWRSLADLTLVPAEAGRGRPHPDLVLTAVLRLEIDDVREVATAGDTTYDILCGLRAGARTVTGVLTGAHAAEALSATGATHVLPSIRDLPAALDL